MTTRIRQLREAFSMTQEELGERLGVKKATVAKYESGALENLKRSTIEEMSKIFGVSPAFIMGWSDDPREPNADERRLLNIFGRLNKLGKAEAIKRISELSCISVYKDPIIDNVTENMTIAAHDNNATAEEMQADLMHALEILRKKQE